MEFLPPEGEVLICMGRTLWGYFGMSWKTSTYIDISYTKMTLWPSRTLWGWSRTSIADEADARHADIFLATLLSLRDFFVLYISPPKINFSHFDLELNCFLPPEGEVLDCMIRLWFRHFGTIQKTSTYMDILYTKMIPRPSWTSWWWSLTLYRRRCQCRGRRHLPSHPPEPQGCHYMEVMHTKMILWQSLTWWR